jgi:hypothetical protein
MLGNFFLLSIFLKFLHNKPLCYLTPRQIPPLQFLFKCQIVKEKPNYNNNPHLKLRINTLEPSLCRLGQDCDI